MVFRFSYGNVRSNSEAWRTYMLQYTSILHYLAWVVTLLTYIRQTHSSTLGHDIDYPDFLFLSPSKRMLGYYLQTDHSLIFLPFRNCFCSLMEWSVLSKKIKLAKMRHVITGTPY
jgi:hypothetical protein